ncbi:MAG: PHP domain-containing protein, partial [Acidobacteriota bacterium]
MAIAEKEREKIKVDLHIHSNISDGLYSPKEVVARASADELDIIAIADHDSIGGICEASKEAQARGLTLIPAIEFS